ncbi:hypothetical protein [Limnochorda pilosa]|uniref:hypothetical protein n=1 Tax=Limnochorda pilosa TaxID=1555112 RepID=UPI0026EBA90F|nr:hypothetical protein [Limnochorda pilosa]
MARPDAPGASARLRRLEELLQRQQEAIRERRPTVLLEVTEALEAEVTAWAAQQEEEAAASGRDGEPDHPAELSPEERRLAQRVRTLYETNQALLEQEAHWVQFMLAHLRPANPTYSDDGRLKPGSGQIIIDQQA